MNNCRLKLSKYLFIVFDPSKLVIRKYIFSCDHPFDVLCTVGRWPEEDFYLLPVSG